MSITSSSRARSRGSVGKLLLPAALSLGFLACSEDSQTAPDAAASGGSSGDDGSDAPPADGADSTSTGGAASGAGGEGAGGAPNAPPRTTFRNPLNDSFGSDPWMIHHEGYYYLSATTWDEGHLTMKRGRTIRELQDASPEIIWTPGPQAASHAI